MLPADPFTTASPCCRAQNQAAEALGVSLEKCGLPRTQQTLGTVCRQGTWLGTVPADARQHLVRNVAAAAPIAPAAPVSNGDLLEAPAASLESSPLAALGMGRETPQDASHL